MKIISTEKLVLSECPECGNKKLWDSHIDLEELGKRVGKKALFCDKCKTVIYYKGK